MIVKKTMIGIACCALVAPLAFGKDSQGVTFENGVTVNATTPVTSVERGEAASYQPPKTLVVRNEGAGLYVLDGRGHVFDSKGQRVQSRVRPGAHVQVYFANNRGVRTVDHVVVD